MPPVYRAALLRVRGGQPSTTNILARTTSAPSKTHCRQAQPALRLSVTAAESEEATRSSTDFSDFHGLNRLNWVWRSKSSVLLRVAFVARRKDCQLGSFNAEPAATATTALRGGARPTCSPLAHR